MRLPLIFHLLAPMPVESGAAQAAPAAAIHPADATKGGGGMPQARMPGDTAAPPTAAH